MTLDTPKGSWSWHTARRPLDPVPITKHHIVRLLLRLMDMTDMSSANWITCVTSEILQ